MLSQARKVAKKIGIYRDDITALAKMSKVQWERASKKLIKIFRDEGLILEVEVNLTVTDFLDIVIDTTQNVIRPYKKPNNSLQYINTKSSHPPCVIKQLPKSISERLSRNSSNQQIFDEEKITYETALEKAGYSDTKLNYVKQSVKNKKVRKRKIIFFNPPFSIGMFLFYPIIRQSGTNQESPFRVIFIFSIGYS